MAFHADDGRRERKPPMFLSLLAAKISAWRRYRESVREVSRLSDRELSDLGIARGDIEFVARQSANA